MLLQAPGYRSLIPDAVRSDGYRLPGPSRAKTAQVILRGLQAVNLGSWGGFLYLDLGHERVVCGFAAEVDVTAS